jgi:DNA segregation ATPase FtsK/SpoIIIE-like protein
MYIEQRKINTRVTSSSEGDRSRLSGVLTAAALASALFLVVAMSGCVYDATTPAQESNLEMRTRIVEEEAQQARQDALNAQVAAQRAQQAAQQQALQSQIQPAPEITESSVETRTVETRGRPVIVVPPPPPTISTGMADDEAVTPLPPESIEWARHQKDLREQDEDRQRY